MIAVEIALARAMVTIARWSGARGFHSRILCYHDVVLQSSGKYANTVADFKGHLEWLAENGYRSVTVREIVTNWPAFTDERVVALTFDDGLLSHIDTVAPLLTSRGYTGTFFIPAGLIEDNRVLASDRGLKGYGETLLMNWNDVRELGAEGFEIGSHSLNHVSVAQQPVDVMQREIAGSKEVLEQKLSHSVSTFGYPYGRRKAFSDTTKRIAVEYGYTAACTTMGWALERKADPLELPRTGLSAADTMATFVEKMMGHWDSYSRLSALR